jgi:hypothetical protein
MVVGLSCAFLLVIAALLLRFGIPRADLPTLGNLKWFALGLAVMFAFLALMGLAGMGSAVSIRDAHRVDDREKLRSLEVGAPVMLETKVSSGMPADSHGWVASKSAGSSTGKTPPLLVDLADGPLQLAGDSYADVDWNLDDLEMDVFLEREEPVTIFGRVVHDPAPSLKVETVFTGHRADGFQKQARFDFLVSAVGTLTSVGCSPGIPLLLLLAGRRRRRELSG